MLLNKIILELEIAGLSIPGKSHDSQNVVCRSITSQVGLIG